MQNQLMLKVFQILFRFFFAFFTIYYLKLVFGSFYSQDDVSTSFTTFTDDEWTHLGKERLETLSAGQSTEPGDLEIDDSLGDDDDADVDAAETQRESEADTAKSGVLKEYLKGP